MKSAYTLLLPLLLIASNGLAQLAGTYKIGSGTGDDYSCLTCANGAFQAIADSNLSGNVVFEVTTDLANETGVVKLSSWATPHTLTIRPSGASTKTITYSNSTAGILLKLDSVSNLTINGSVSGSGRYLRFVSAQTAHTVIELNNDCKKVSILNCEIRSDNANTSPIFAGAINLRSFGKTGNDDITIENNLIENNPGGAKLSHGILVSPPNLSGQEVENLLIKDNEFNNVAFRGIELTAGVGKVKKAVVQGNSFYADSAWIGSNDAQAMSFVYLNNGEEHVIDGNYFGGQQAQAGGGKMNLDLAQFSDKLFLFRVGSGVSGANAIVFKKNTIKNLQVIGSSGLAMHLSMFKVNSACSVPITFGSETIAADGNVVGSNNSNSNTQASANIYIKERLNSTNNVVYAFQLEGSAKHVIGNNSIGGILMENNSTFGLACQLMYCNGGSEYSIVSNQIGLATDNVVKTSKGMLRLIYSKGKSTVSDNSIDGINAKGSFADDLSLISIDPDGKEVNVISNQVGGINSIVSKNSSTAEKSLYGILISGGNATGIIVVGNAFDKLNTKADDASKVTHLFGIKPTVESSGSYRIDSNFISGSQESNGEFVCIDVASPNSSNAKIRGNRVKASTSNFFENELIGIDVAGKVTHTNLFEIQNNLIGDTSLNVNFTISAIKLSGGASGKSKTAFGIRVSEPTNVVLIDNNAVGGVYSNSSGRELPFIPILVGGVRDSLVVENNAIGNRNGLRNMVFNNHSEFEYLMYFDLPDGLTSAIIRNNSIAGVQFMAMNSDAKVYGIRSTKGTAIGDLWISNNTLSDLHIDGSGEKEFTGIYTDNNNTHLLGNKVNNVLVLSSKIGDQFWGLYVAEKNSSHEIRNNRIEKITLRRDQNESQNAIGIFTYGPSSTFSISENYISEITLGVVDSSALFQGIIINSCVRANIHNNVILHGTNVQVSSQQAYGIYDFANAGDIFILHNTVDLKVNFIPGGQGRTACYYKNNNATRKISNNLFANHSSNVGGPHYALYFASSAGAIGSDFNLLHVTADPNKLTHFAVNYDINGWRQKGFGLKSIAPPSQNFVNLGTGEQLTSLGNDIGLTTLGINTDFNGNSRPMDGGYDIGAFEIATAGLPSGITSVNDHYAAAAIRLSLFPNPASDVVHINLEEVNLQEVELRIINNLGQTVKTHLPNGWFDSIDLSELNAGVYILQLVGGSGLVTEKRFTKL